MHAYRSDSASASRSRISKTISTYGKSVMDIMCVSAFLENFAVSIFRSDEYVLTLEIHAESRVRSSGLWRHVDPKMETICSSETLVSTYESTRRHNTQ
jgi:hypothetical protein